MSDFAVERVMSIARADFLRLLPLVTGDCLVNAEGTVELTHEGKRVVILLREEASLTIASLQLPRLRVRIELPPDAQFQQDFLRRFDRVFQRGGG